jgi:hypothetical protein
MYAKTAYLWVSSETPACKKHTFLVFAKYLLYTIYYDELVIVNEAGWVFAIISVYKESIEKYVSPRMKFNPLVNCRLEQTIIYPYAEWQQRMRRPHSLGVATRSPEARLSGSAPSLQVLIGLVTSNKLHSLSAKCK